MMGRVQAFEEVRCTDGQVSTGHINMKIQVDVVGLNLSGLGKRARVAKVRRRWFHGQWGRARNWRQHQVHFGAYFVRLALISVILITGSILGFRKIKLLSSILLLPFFLLYSAGNSNQYLDLMILGLSCHESWLTIIRIMMDVKAHMYNLGFRDF